MSSMVLGGLVLIGIFALAWFVTTYVAAQTQAHDKIAFDIRTPESVAYDSDTDPGDDGRFV